MATNAITPTTIGAITAAASTAVRRGPPTRASSFANGLGGPATPCCVTAPDETDREAAYAPDVPLPAIGRAATGEVFPPGVAICPNGPGCGGGCGVGGPDGSRARAPGGRDGYPRRIGGGGVGSSSCSPPRESSGH